jgi:rRNA maturation protein Nop10
MKLTLKDFETAAPVFTLALETVEICGQHVYVATAKHASFADEFEQALYGLNNGSESGVIADNWTDDYQTPINPYMTWSFQS